MVELMLEHIKKGILLSMVVSMPPIIAAASAGLLIGILQAVTQVQEQTLSSVPKIILVFAILLIGSGAMLELFTSYIREAAHLAFVTLPHAGSAHMLPSG
jgi:flagellar biosynthetic protein FliQ